MKLASYTRALVLVEMPSKLIDCKLVMIQGKQSAYVDADFRFSFDCGIQAPLAQL